MELWNAMAGQEIGRALLLVNENFTGDLSKREGAEWNLINMHALFTVLKFKTTAFKDQTATQMIQKLKDFVEELCHNSPQCSAVIISSHGQEVKEETQGAQSQATESQDVVRLLQGVFGVDGQYLMMDEIFSFFNRPELKEKQKWFFIQACRSRTFECHDPGVSISVLTAPGSGIPQLANWKARNNIIREYANRLPCERKPGEWQDNGQQPKTGTPGRTQSERGSKGQSTDVIPFSSTVQSVPLDNEVLISNLLDNSLVVSSATAGHVSYRDTTVGSLMYHFMYRNAVTLLRDGNILRYLTVVAGEIARLDIVMDNKRSKACLALQHTLCQRADFREREPRLLLKELEKQSTN